MATSDDSVPGGNQTPSTRDDGPMDPTGERPRSGGGLVPLLAGGFLAGGIGYLAAYYTEFGLFDSGGDDEVLVQSIAAQEARLDDIETLLGAPDETGARLDEAGIRLDETGARLEETGTRLDASEQSLSELRESLASVDERLGGVEQGLGAAPQDGVLGQSALDELSAETETRVSGLLEEISAIEERVAGLAEQVEANSGGPTEEEVAALEQRMSELAALIDERQAELEAQFEEQQAAIAEAEAAAAAETSRISAQAGLSEIRAAVENGEPFRQAVGTVESAAGVDVPEALTSVADEGVATLAELQADFPDASREALGVAVRETAGDSPVDRFGAFLKAQTGARSLGEQTGDAPDAVLSRAAARLDEGDVAAALEELQALPEGGRAAMDGWLSRARARVDANAAVSDLSQNLNTN